MRTLLRWLGSLFFRTRAQRYCKDPESHECGRLQGPPGSGWKPCASRRGQTDKATGDGRIGTGFQDRGGSKPVDRVVWANLAQLINKEKLKCPIECASEHERPTCFACADEDPVYLCTSRTAHCTTGSTATKDCNQSLFSSKLHKRLWGIISKSSSSAYMLQWYHRPSRKVRGGVLGLFATLSPVPASSPKRPAASFHRRFAERRVIPPCP